eukprot:2327339-Pyramimonas_sp.AAC.1
MVFLLESAYSRMRRMSSRSDSRFLVAMSRSRYFASPGACSESCWNASDLSMSAMLSPISLGAARKAARLATLARSCCKRAMSDAEGRTSSPRIQ